MTTPIAVAKTKPLRISPRLEKEFETVVAIWATNADTRTVDALLLSWIKLEKQLRRLLCFLVYQHEMVDRFNKEDIVTILVESENLSPRVFIAAIEALHVPTVKDMIGADHSRLHQAISKVRKLRNKIAHGQVTGLKLDAKALEQHVHLIIEWIAQLADGAHRAIGYDGLRRNTYRTAKLLPNAVAVAYPFETTDEFKGWLKKIAEQKY